VSSHGLRELVRTPSRLFAEYSEDSASPTFLFSERQPGPELKHPRPPGPGNPAEVRAVHVRLGIVVILPVQQVEDLGSNLKPRMHSEWEAFGQRRVQILVARTAHHLGHVGARSERG